MQPQKRDTASKKLFTISITTIRTLKKAHCANIQNHIDSVGKKNLDLKVILNGKGISLLLKPDAVKDATGNATDDIQMDISGLKEQGVAFQVCANTLRANRIRYEKDLYDVSKADIVPSGVAELARLQGLGYAYIKP